MNEEKQKPKQKRRGRIDAKTDYNILADIALGVTSKDIAAKYDVSVSYVSKVRTGRKKINVYIPDAVKEHNRLASYKDDIEVLMNFFKANPMALDTADNLDSLIIDKLSELKILLSVRKKLKED